MLRVVALLLLGVCIGPALAKEKYLPAFPGAEGFGAFTPGGRGGKVLLVTTLEDYDSTLGQAPIPGSLRQAIETRGPRIVLFRLSGTVFLKRSLTVNEPFLTIAGQSAPGDGICIARYRFGVSAHDVIIRHLRFRLGDEARGEIGTFQVAGAQNVIVDHCSFSWSMDENCTLHGGEARNLTVQWSIISESLNRSFHPKGEHGHGSLLRSDDGGFSLHHCIYAHNNSRNPRPGGYEDQPGLLLDFRNNVVYDWGAASGYSGLERTRLNYVANYFKAGPSTSRAVREFAFSAQTFRTKMYWADNYFYQLPQKTAENFRMIRKWGDWEGELKDTNLLPTPFPTPPISQDPAPVAFEKVLGGAGATLPRRDAVDARVIQEIRDGTGRIIDSQNEVGGWPSLKTSPAPPDEDQDGMPDAWEKRFQLDSGNSSDGAQDLDEDGYTNLEEYLNNTDPKISDRKPLGFDFDAVLARLEESNQRSRAEIAEEKRRRPAEAGMDGSAPPPFKKMDLRTAAGGQVAVLLDKDLTLELRHIPAGKFVMGSPAGEPERKNDEAQHEVTISRGFYLGKTHVTAAQYRAVVAASAAHGREGDLPAEVTWSDAVRFCHALSKNTGRSFRLPTEAEWEYACRAGTTTAFNIGATISTDQANYDGKFVYPGGQAGQYRREPTPVGTFEPNAWGLLDMHGNAYQWCSDWYGPYTQGPVTDPQGPPSGNARVIRGGKYGSAPRYLRSAARYCYNPNNSSVVFGFRVVMEAEEPK